MSHFFAAVATSLQLQAPFTALVALIVYSVWRTYGMRPMRDVATGWMLWTARMVVVSYSAALRDMGVPPTTPERRVLTALGIVLIIAALPYLVHGTANLARGNDEAPSPRRWSVYGAAVFGTLSVVTTAQGAPMNWRVAVQLFASTISFALAFGYLSWLLLRIPRDEVTTGRRIAALGFAGYALKQLWNVRAFVLAGPPEAAASAVAENIALIMVALGTVALLFDRLRQREVLAEREQRRLEAELTARDRLDSLGRLAGGVAHDFNNMLTTILGNAQIARSAGADEDVSEELANIETTAKRASALTRQLLAFARRDRITPTVIDLASNAERVRRFLAPQLASTTEFTVRVMSTGLYVVSDPDRIEQAIVNLVKNAEEALEGRPGSIDLTVDAVSGVLDGDAVRIVVEDSGTGMTEEVQSHLFEPFFTTKSKQRGTGLGLSIVHGAVMQADGRIDVQSTLGSGTRISILLPRASQPPVVPTPPSPSPAANIDLTNACVLVVDDDPLVRRVAVRVLRKHNLRVFEAGDVEEALALHAAESAEAAIQLLLTDLVMPGANGRTLARMLRERDAELRVVYMSGYEADTFTDEPDAPAGPFLAKPFTEQQLLGAMRNALAGVPASA